MNEQLVLFENEEVKVRTDEGHVLINLVHTAKCCGLIRTRGNSKLIRWDDIKKKLSTISSSIESSTPQYIEETQYILDEIDNTDDRTQIYMSSWLSKRLAMECKSDLAMKYKNFLATLDEKRENGQLQYSNKDIANLISTSVQSIVPVIVTEITKQFAPIMLDAKAEVNKVTGLLYDQSVIHKQETDEIKALIGFRSINTTKIINGVKEKLSDKLGYKVMASSNIFQKVKKAIFKEYDVVK